jgi:hypothetical protein
MTWISWPGKLTEHCLIQIEIGMTIGSAAGH